MKTMGLLFFLLSSCAVAAQAAVKMKSSDVLWLPGGTTQTLTNRAAGPSRFLLVYFKDSAVMQPAGSL